MANARPAGAGQRRSVDLPVEQLSDQTWSLGLDLPAGNYEVNLFGDGPQGDVAAAIQLTVATP